MSRRQRVQYSTPWKLWLVSGNWLDLEDHPTYEGTTNVDYESGNKTKSEGHRGYKNLDASEDVGGDFQVYKVDYSEFFSLGDEPKDYSIHTPWLTPRAPGITHHFYLPKAYEGSVHDGSEIIRENIWSPTSNAELDVMGTTAISRMIPTSPIFGAAAFLGELREGLPKLAFQTWQGRTIKARKAGSDYLNAEFGWKPLVSDIQKFSYAVQNADRVLKQYSKDAGKLLHRRYDFPTETDTYEVEVGGRFPQPNWDYDLYHPVSFSEGRLKKSYVYTTERWCEATFKFFLPPMGSMERSTAEFAKIYGTRLTPDVVWQLTPWSWAIDWFTNAGEVAANISAFMHDGLVMPYAYMMEKKTIVAEYQLTGIAWKSYNYQQVLRQTVTTTIKTRRKATPFGFGIDADALSGRQLAILAALGISRGSK